MADFKAHRLAFNGFALEPLTDAGQEFLDNFEWEDSVFRHPDACMEFLPESAVGFEPFLMSEIIAEMKDRGLTWTD